MNFLSIILARATRWIRRPAPSPCCEPQLSPCTARSTPSPPAVEDFSLEKFDIDRAEADRLPRYALSDQNFVVDELEYAAALDRGHLTQR
jgi:hypothetical protein